MTTRRTFPHGFTWGTATAAYQVEGAVDEDGRTPSIWDTMTHTPGRIKDGTNGDVAVDQYHRYLTDVQLMRELGVSAYRFSLSWSRIQPHPGSLNQLGLDHYKRLVDALLEAGITPLATLYHWDLPQYLEDAGGWPTRDTAYRYSDYVSIVATALADRIKTWGTLNEPWCSAYLGYADGEHAPGLHDHPAALSAAHHLNLAHGLGVQAIRAAQAEARVSVTLNLQVLRPASDSVEDRAAVAQCDRVGNGVWLKPMLEGHYDPQLLKDTAHVSDWSFIKDGDLQEIWQPLDFLGVNYYSTATVRRTPSAVSPTWDDAHSMPWVGAWPGTETIEFLPPTGPLTAMGWNQEPEALTELLVDLHDAYPGLDLVVTENGAAFDDEYSPGHDVHDPLRTAYYAAHIEAIGKAIDAGAPVTGYFAWSLVDNFEWAWGHEKRFGLFYVDYVTQTRVWKDTGRWYAEVARTNTLPELVQQSRHLPADSSETDQERHLPRSRGNTNMPQWRQLEAGQRSRLHIVDLDGTDRVIHESDEAIFEAPNWAADGSIIFNQDGWLYSWCDGAITRIETSVADFNNDHVLDPDGKHIFATSEDGHIYRVPLAGGEAIRVTRDGDGLMAHYLHGVSPDGGVLLHIGGAARADGAVYNVYAFALHTGVTTALTDSTKPHDGAEFSPDSQWVYFNAERNSSAAGHSQLFRMAPDGGSAEQLTSDERVNWFPHLSPDGTRMTYISFPSGTIGHPANAAVEIVLTDPLATTEVLRIDAFGGQGSLNVNSWAPDSERFAYCDYPID